MTITCSICLETNTDITTPCGHTFHRECLKKHVIINTFTCPYCRCDIKQYIIDNISLDELDNDVKTSFPIVPLDLEDVLENVLENEVEEEIQDLYRLLCYWDDYVEDQAIP